MSNNLEKIVLLIKSRIGRKSVEISLSSSALQKASYDAHRKSLRLLFSSGGLYEYGSVEARKFYELVSSPSAGKYFHQEIKNAYPYRKINLSEKSANPKSGDKITVSS